MNTMKAKNKGKQAKGYVPYDFNGNLWRAAWGKTTIEQFVQGQKQIAYNPDKLRLGILLFCCDARKTKQVKFFTCSELVRMLAEPLNLLAPAKKNKNGTDPIKSANRKLRKICGELGIELRPARAGRPPKKIRNF